MIPAVDDTLRSRLKRAFPLLFRRLNPPHAPLTAHHYTLPAVGHVSAYTVRCWNECPYPTEELPDTCEGFYPPPMFPLQEASVERRDRSGRLQRTLHLRAIGMVWKLVSVTEDELYKRGQWVPFPA